MTAPTIKKAPGPAGASLEKTLHPDYALVAPQSASTKPVPIPLADLVQAKLSGSRLASDFIFTIKQRHEIVSDSDALFFVLGGAIENLFDSLTTLERATLMGVCQTLQKALERGQA